MGYRPRPPAPIREAPRTPPVWRRQPKPPDVWLKRKMLSLWIAAVILIWAVVMPFSDLVMSIVGVAAIGVYLVGSIGVARSLRSRGAQGVNHYVDTVRDLLAHEHQPVSVHLAGYPEKGIWKDSLLGYLCVDPECSKQLSVEEVHSRQEHRKKEEGYYRHVAAERGASRLGASAITATRVPDHLTKDDGGGPLCHHCNEPFFVGDYIRRIDHGPVTHVDCEKSVAMRVLDAEGEFIEDRTHGRRVIDQHRSQLAELTARKASQERRTKELKRDLREFRESEWLWQ